MGPAHSRDLPIKRSVALVIRSELDPTLVLAVLRPPDDEDLPDVWGLPAASLRSGESWLDAVRRAARDKLGIEVDPGALLNEGAQRRPSYSLEMRVYEASIRTGEPDVQQPAQRATRYVAWKWAAADSLAPAAEKGSLCARLFLESDGSRYL
jgi:ADP-ribose pyrophosphatase YjhB (NUDIX family)